MGTAGGTCVGALCAVGCGRAVGGTCVDALRGVGGAGNCVGTTFAGISVGSLRGGGTAGGTTASIGFFGGLAAWVGSVGISVGFMLGRPSGVSVSTAVASGVGRIDDPYVSFTVGVNSGVLSDGSACGLTWLGTTVPFGVAPRLVTSPL